MDTKFNRLWNITDEQWLADDKAVEDIIKLVLQLKIAIHDALIQNVTSVSDILVTKIMLGTIGCSPAYDQYFKAGLGLHGINPQSFNYRSLENILAFCRRNVSSMNEIRQQMKDLPTICPIADIPFMKIIDMFFYTEGQ